MFSPFLGMLGTWVILMGICEAGNFDHANLAPLSIVYTVYPYYNSDTLLGIFKAEEALQFSNDVNALGRQTDEQESRNSADSEASDATSGSVHRESLRNDSNESSVDRNEATAEITYWPPNQRGAAPKSRLSKASTNLRTGN